MTSGLSGGADVISLPKGGGALHGIGEKFAPDLHTGTGNFTVPIAIPPGRNGLQPTLALSCSTGRGNGLVGVGWSLDVPYIALRTAKGVPLYDGTDVRILSGAEDLVPVPGAPSGAQRYRPRTEGLYAQIDHFHLGTNHWRVRTKDGLVSQYATPRPLDAGSEWRDPAAVVDPGNPEHVFAWRLTRTVDPFGNRIEYAYERDAIQTDGPHCWDQLYLKQVRYVDYGDADDPNFLVTVELSYEDRPDRFSEYRAGFEIRTVRRCSRIDVVTHAGADRPVRTYHLRYADREPARAPSNALSLLTQIQVEGHDGSESEWLPPLEFGYTSFEPARRDFFPIEAPEGPPESLASPAYELVDLLGNGLPDVLELNGSARYWRNRGERTFDLPRELPAVPLGLGLADPGVQIVDADGDGRADLLATIGALNGYFPLRAEGPGETQTFRAYRSAPTFDLEDPKVRLVDLDGDGVTDAIRSGSRLECFFNDPREGWKGMRCVERQAADIFPDVDFSDSRVRWGDMTGDGLQDIVLVHNRLVEYWPSLGRGGWAHRVSMRNSPSLPAGYDPRRILLGDVDGDGAADIVYVDNARLTLWINQNGNGFADPIEIEGTPPVSDADAVRLVDLLGTGVAGVLWSLAANGRGAARLFFHDFTGGVKPYLPNEMDNHIGALTRVEYWPSTRFYSEDELQPETRWRTTLPFPVQCVARVETVDAISRGKRTSTYRYRHGSWDGAEREFRGFARVDQRDSEFFQDFNAGAAQATAGFDAVPVHSFSPPTETRTWFCVGPVGDEFGAWSEPDFSDEFWAHDPSLLSRPSALQALLAGLPRRVRRDALRALRGTVLRTELYALDGTARANRPYTVTEQLFGVREEALPVPGEHEGPRIFSAHAIAERTTQWERGDEPMMRLTFTSDYDAYGQPRSQTSIAVPREAGEPYLATQTVTAYAQRDDDDIFIVNRVARTTVYEIVNDGSQAALDLFAEIMAATARRRVIGQTLSFYDGDAFTGLPLGIVGQHGALSRSERLSLTEEILQEAYGGIPPYLANGPPSWTDEYPDEFRKLLPPLAGYTFRAAGPDWEQGWFAATEQHAVGERGLLVAMRDALGHEVSMGYDAFELLAGSVTDPAGLTTEAVYDYRLFQPRLVIDPNGRRSEFTFTPLGLLASSSVKAGTGEIGDLVSPSVRLEYYFLAFAAHGEPISVRMIRRVHHDADLDVALPVRDETVETREYSDGFGRIVQTRAQAEEVAFGDPTFGGKLLPLDQALVPGDAVSVAVPDRVVVAGWQVYDNKGRVVEKFEPFFTTGWHYAPATNGELGRKMAFEYDPVGRSIRTINTDGSEQITLHGVPHDLASPGDFVPTPWEAFAYDANDNAGRTHPTESASYAQHWNTPASTVVDALGRAIRAVARVGSSAYVTRSTYDIRGNVVTVRDPVARVAFAHAYDLADRALRVESLDGGARLVVLDAAGNIIEQRDAKGALVLRVSDALNRPARVWARDGDGAFPSLRERIDYGDGGNAGQPAEERAAQRVANRLGRLHRHYDEAGLLTVEAYDFKGNVLEKARRPIADAALLAAFTPHPPGWAVQVFRVDWQPPPETAFEDHAAALLEPDAFVTSTTFDALNRMKNLRYPEDLEGERRELRTRYNRAGLLERVEFEGSPIVERIAYDAKRQRTMVTYGNGLLTRCAYEADTFRLARMRTERATAGPAGYHLTSPAQPLQDLGYRYDRVGNLKTISDRTPGCGVAATLAGPDALERDFDYDPLYRLTSATGRECADLPAPRPWSDYPRCGTLPNQTNAPQLTSTYAEQYAYDPSGNLLSLKHVGASGSWTRHFGVGGMKPQPWNAAWQQHLDAASWPDAPSNRLTHVGDNAPLGSATHVFDDNGNLVAEATTRHFEWDAADRLRVYRTQVEGSEPSVHAQYLYDSSGRRVKKFVRRQGGAIDVTISVDGVFERRRLIGPSASSEHDDLHAFDGLSRVAMIRVGPPLPDDKTPAAKFYFGDHLGSGVLIVDGSGFWVSREEFTPYGETSFGGHVRKRFRFTGKERDEESGLTYHGVRYYAPWVARWLSCDPARSRDASSLYAYAASNPLKFVDLTGAQQQSVQYTRAEFAQQACLTAEHCSGADAGDPEPPATITPATPNQSVVEPARPEEATGAATHSVPLAEAARTAVKYGFAPVDPAGVRLAPPYNLWSGQAGEAAATAAPGFVEAGTLEGARARGMVQEWIREGKYPPAALDNPRLLSAEDFDRAWVRTSRALARQAAISEAPVENFGPTNPGSVKATVELPTIARWGAAAGVAMAAVGFLSIYASSEQPSGSPSQAILAGAGVTEVTGGIIYGSGAILANGKLMAIGSGVSTVGGSVAMLTSASRHWPLSPGQTLRPA